MFTGSQTARTVADTVTALMKDRGLTQVGLAEATEIPRRTLQRYLGNEKPFRLDVLDLVAEALGTTSVEILASTEDAA